MQSRMALVSHMGISQWSHLLNIFSQKRKTVYCRGLGSLHHIYVGAVAGVSELNAACIIRVEVSKVCDSSAVSLRAGTYIYLKL
jgi:hypothetical protein